MRGKFMVLDGIDHCGKGLQIDLLKKALPEVYFTREPGGTPLAEEFRTILLRKDGHASNPMADFFLFLAGRGSHVEDVVSVKCKSGIHVLSDRYDSSTNAFQIHGEERRDLEKLFWAIRGALPSAYIPDAYIILDLHEEVAHERGVKAAEKEKSRFDVKPVAYHKRVRRGFQSFADRIRESKAQAHIIDADRTPEDVHQDILKVVRSIIAA